MDNKDYRETKNHEDQQEAKLLKKASHRAGFKMHLAIFFLGNIFLWIIWYFLIRGGEDATTVKISNGLIFLSIIWFIVLIFHYLFVYQWNKTMVEKELLKLKRELKEKEKELDKLKEDSAETINNN